MILKQVMHLPAGLDDLVPTLFLVFIHSRGFISSLCRELSTLDSIYVIHGRESEIGAKMSLFFFTIRRSGS